MKKAVSYARFSSENQREESIEAQLKYIKEYAGKNNMQIIKEYTDRAKSATTTARPQFLQMLEDIELEKIDVDYVIVHKLDRFARDRIDAALSKKKLRDCDVSLLSVSENIDDSPASILLESVLEGQSEFYSANLSQEVFKGLLENAEKAKFCGGVPPLGFDVDKDGKYKINIIESKAVKTIFEMFLEGYNYRQIADDLNEKGYRTKQGKEFKKNSVHDILRNEKYAGIYVFNKRQKRKRGKRSNRKYKSEDDLVKIEGVIPNIITKEQFNQVQEILNNRKRRKNRGYKSSEAYILSGIIYCEKCGEKMFGDLKKGSHKTYRYYTCSGKKKGCKQSSLNKEMLEDNIINKLLKEVFDPELAFIYHEKVNKKIEEQQKANNEHLEVLNQELKKTNGKIKNLIEFVEDGLASEDIKNRLKELENKKEGVRQEINEIEKEKEAKKIPLETIQEFLKEKKYLLIKRDKSKCQAICRSFINKVIVNDKNIEIEFDDNRGGLNGAEGGIRTHTPEGTRF